MNFKIGDKVHITDSEDVHPFVKGFLVLLNIKDGAQGDTGSVSEINEKLSYPIRIEFPGHKFIWVKERYLIPLKKQ